MDDRATTWRTVREVAALSGITVRTLHHYDAIGLLRPKVRTDAGYRLYGDDDLVRLHAILTWRSLGFPLDEIRALVDDPDHDPLESLVIHRSRLVAEAERLDARIAAVDTAIRKHLEGRTMTHDELKEILDGFDPAEHEAEAEQRWGHTEAYRESRRRTQRYRAADWQRIKDEMQAVEGRFAALLASGVPPDHPDAVAAADAHRDHIAHWFYDVSPAMHRGLAALYVDDPRFRAHYEQVAPGLAQYVHDAILALNAGA